MKFFNEQNSIKSFPVGSTALVVKRCKDGSYVFQLENRDVKSVVLLEDKNTNRVDKVFKLPGLVGFYELLAILDSIGSKPLAFATAVRNELKMRIYVDIMRESCPSGRDFYTYRCEAVALDFSAPHRVYHINPYELEGSWITLEQEAEGFNYYQSDITIDVNGIHPDFSDFFFKELAKKLKGNFNEKEVSEEELVELVRQIKPCSIEENDSYDNVASACM